MGIVSTTNKIEAEKTGKIYLDKEFFIWMNKMKPKKIHRCEECKIVINLQSKTIRKHKNKVFCGEWCRDEYKFRSEQLHTCKKCGETVEPFLREGKKKNGNIVFRKTGIYPKYCSNCRKRKNEKYNKEN